MAFHYPEPDNNEIKNSGKIFRKHTYNTIATVDIANVYRKTTFAVVKVHFHFNNFAVETHELCHTIFGNVNNGG